MAEAMSKPSTNKPPMWPRTASDRRMTIGKPQQVARARLMPKKAAIAQSGQRTDDQEEDE